MISGLMFVAGGSFWMCLWCFAVHFLIVRRCASTCDLGFTSTSSVRMPSDIHEIVIQSVNKDI